MSEGNSRESLTSQQRNLLLAEPIARLSLDRRVAFKDDPTIADRLDVQYLALSAIDFVMERSAVESGASPDQIVEHVAAEATRVKPSLTDEQRLKVGRVVLDYLANARDGHKAFRVEYYDADRGGYSFHDFRLLALSVAADGSVKFKLARGAQILTLAMLDVAPEFAQEAEAIMIRKAVERGRFKDARTLAQRARMRSIHYQQFIEDRLFQVRRAADRIVWSVEVLPELDEARAHLSERRKHEVAIIESIREHIAHARGDTRDHLVDLKNTFDECRQRHAALFERVMSASEEFRQIQVNAFRARRTLNVPDLEERILVPLLASPMRVVSGMSDEVGIVFAAPTPPRLFDLALLFESVNERRQELLEADRESLEATGLASIDKDVRAVTERLRASGMSDAQPYAVYLSAIVRSRNDVRGFAELDPARFVGVAVPNRKALEAARRVLQSPPPLSRPVSVAIANDVAGETPGDRFVLAVDEPAAYDRGAAQDLKRRLEGGLARIGESNEAVRRRLQRLKFTLQSLDTWRERFGGGRLDTMRQSMEKTEARNEEIRAELGALSTRIETDEGDARLCRNRARECDEQAHACADRARRACEHHAQWESRVEEWQLERLRHEQAVQAAEARARDCQTKRDVFAEKARTGEREAAKAANGAADMEREIGDIEFTALGGRISENLDALRRDYEHHLETLKNLERERVDHLRGQRQEIQRTLDRKEDRFGQEFGELDRAEVETEAERDGVRDAAATADIELETARTNASIVRADTEGAEKGYRTERDRRAAEIKPDAFVDLRAYEPEELAGFASRVEETIVQQDALRAREAEAAERTRQEAIRNDRAAKEYMSWGTTLERVLHGESAAPERLDLPRHDEVAALVNDTVAGLVQTRAALSEAHKRVYESYDAIRKFMNSPAFSRLDGERKVAVHLSESDALAAAAHAPGTAGLIDDRLKSIGHDLLRLDDDLQACIEELDHLLRTALHIVRRMVRDGRIPDHVPRFGGQPVFRISADLTDIATTQRREILRSYISDLVEDDRVPERGQDIAAEMVERMTAALGRSTLDIRLLKPKGEGDTEHMPIERVTVSGGELLTAAMMIYLVIARLRADAMHGGTGEAGVLILDNPLGKANKALLLKTQMGLADAMGIQLFYATGVQDTSALAAFENIVRLRRNRQSRATRRIHVEIEKMHAHIDRITDGEASAAATAELAAN